MRVLSLFDGISCGRVALERAGIPVETYYASEVDKYAIKIALKNYPDTIQLGDVKGVWARNLPKIDLLIGGSPCQDLSIAKAGRKGLSGERSSLFWHYVRLLRTCKPRWFLFENVASMPAADKAIITKELGVEPIMINSALVSAQQRKRLYWTNIPGVTQPEDKGLLLKDILESGQSFEKKSFAITASYNKAVIQNTLSRKQRTMVAEPVLYNKFNQSVNVNKSPAIGAGCGVANSKTEQLVVTQIKPKRIGAIGPYQQDRVYSIEGKNVSLKGNGGGGGTNTGLIAQSVKLGYLAHGGDRQGYKVYSVFGKRICLKSSTNNGSPNELYRIDLPDADYYIRKLSPVECERLQTLPDNYTAGISNTQRYKCLGNGWTVDVIAHILRGLKNEKNGNR